jgi:glutamate formiminotransferase
MSKAIIECVPNFSEGVDRERVLAIVRAMQVPGVSLLDWSQDADHNRSVVTIAGPPAAVVEAAVLAAGKAAEVIDLTRQTGVHPRIGAADVIPFVPVRDIHWSTAPCWRGRRGRRSGAATTCLCTSTRPRQHGLIGRG